MGSKRLGVQVILLFRPLQELTLRILAGFWMQRLDGDPFVSPLWHFVGVLGLTARRGNSDLLTYSLTYLQVLSLRDGRYWGNGLYLPGSGTAWKTSPNDSPRSGIPGSVRPRTHLWAIYLACCCSGKRSISHHQPLDEAYNGVDGFFGRHPCSNVLRVPDTPRSHRWAVFFINHGLL
jgi:hypothetical protein